MSRPQVRWIAFGALGFEFAVAVVVGLYLGVSVDDWFGISPFGVVSGILFGMGAALFRLLAFVKVIKRVERDELARENSDQERIDG